MKKILFAIILLLVCGCSLIAPNYSKAETEKEQLEQMKIQNELMKEQNKWLMHIAISLEAIKDRSK